MSAEKVREETKEPAPAEKGRFNMTTLAVVAAVLLLEGVTVALVMWISGGPRDAAAQTVQVAQPPVQVEDVDELVVEGKATNTKRGTAYVYRFRICARLQPDKVGELRAVMEKRKASVEDVVRQVVARLNPKDLEEPELVTARRMLINEFEPIFGDGLIKQLIIPEWTWQRADY